MFSIRAKNLDNPKSTQYHASLIRTKRFLKNIYINFYTQFKNSLPTLKDKVIIEIGSGGGFIKEIMPQAITSDIMKLKNVDMKFSVLQMPFKNNSVDAFFMIDVFHHIPDSKKFLTEMLRCLKKNGKIIMIEPANTLWGGFAYKYFHHELYDPKGAWKFKSNGPLSSSNLALPWIVFVRDRNKFLSLFPELNIIRIHAHTPFLYLLSGGLSFPQLVPSWSYPFFNKFEKLLEGLNPLIGMFYTIELVKK